KELSTLHRSEFEGSEGGDSPGADSSASDASSGDASGGDSADSITASIESNHAVPAVPAVPVFPAASLCDLYHGRWVHTRQRALYSGERCKWISLNWACARSNRPREMRDYERLRWQPRGCSAEQFSAEGFFRRKAQEVGIESDLCERKAQEVGIESDMCERKAQEVGIESDLCERKAQEVGIESDLCERKAQESFALSVLAAPSASASPSASTSPSASPAPSALTCQQVKERRRIVNDRAQLTSTFLPPAPLLCSPPVLLSVRPSSAPLLSAPPQRPSSAPLLSAPPQLPPSAPLLSAPPQLPPTVSPHVLPSSAPLFSVPCTPPSPSLPPHLPFLSGSATTTALPFRGAR
ncbi:unnamed protein product, partial [Closterium sp. NIES-53]